MAQLDFIIQETVQGKRAKGIAISSITRFGLEERSSGQGIAKVLILFIETADGKLETFNGDAASSIYKELRKLAIVV